MRRYVKAAGVALLMVACIGVGRMLHAKTPITLAASASQVSDIGTVRTQFRQGVEDLASQRDAARQAGSAAIRHAMVSLMGQMIAAGGLVHQARVGRLLEFQADLSRWGEALMKLPPQRRMSLLQWGMAPNILPLVAGACSDNPRRRANAAHPLAQIPGWNADWLLERLLTDPYRLVYITAMDAVWNRKPTAAMVKTLWRRMLPDFQWGRMGYFPRERQQYTTTFHGQDIAIVYADNDITYPNQLRDSQLAAQLLAHWKPRELDALAAAYLADVCRNPQATSVISQPKSMQAENFAKIAVGMHRAAVAPWLLYLLHRPLTMNVNLRFNNRPIHFSNRSLPLWLLVKLAGLSPAAYHLYKVHNFHAMPEMGISNGNYWVCRSVRGEDTGIQKITAWYAKHSLKAVTQSRLKRPSIVTPPVMGRPAQGSAHPVPAFRLSSIARALKQFRYGLRKLSSQEYSGRHAGSRAICQAMASLLANMMGVGGVNHAARVVRLLEFQGNLSGWGEVLVRLPPPRRMVLLQWGKAPELLPLVAKAFSPRWQQRANAAHPLAKIAGANADWILEQLLRNPQRLVYIRALDAVWRRKPTPAMIQTLWFHALVFLGISVNFPPAPPRKTMFCGQTITVGPDVDCVSAPNGLAMETLVHWNPPGITRLTINALAKISRMSAAQDPFNWPYDIRAKDLAKLILLAKPVMVEPYLLYMANRPSRQAVSFTSNHQPRYFSNHTMPLYLLVKLAHQNPSAFHLYHTPMYGGTWAGGTARQENAAIKKITAWYAKHGIEPVTKVQLKKMKMPPIGAFRRP